MSQQKRSTSGLGRRSLVRAGATAAWTAPVVAMAAPAQAAACSGGSTTLVATVVPGSQHQVGRPKLHVTVQVTVCNTGTSDTCALSATAAGHGASAKLNAFTVGSWPPATVGGGGTTSLTVSAPEAADQLDAGKCTTYQVAFTLHDGEGKHDTTITFRSSNGGLATVTIHTER